MAAHYNIFAREITGPRSLVGYSPWGHKESDKTEWLNNKTKMLHQILITGYLVWMKNTFKMLEIVQHNKSKTVAKTKDTRVDGYQDSHAMCSGVPLTACIEPGSTHLVAPSGWPWANYIPNLFIGFPGGTSDKEPACQCRRLKRHGFDPRIRKIPWRRPWQPTPVFLPEESLGHRSQASYSPLEGHKEWDTTEAIQHACNIFSTLAWKIPWMEEPRRLQSMGSLRVGHD